MSAAAAWLRLSLALSSARPTALLVALLGGTLVLTERAGSSFWLGYHQDTGMYLSVLSFAIAGSLFAVAGYRTAVRRLVGAPESARAGRPTGAVLRMHVAGDLGWLLAGLLLVHVAAYARTAAVAGELSPMGASLSALGLGAATLCYAVGVALGAVVRRMLGIVVVAAIPYALTLYANLSMSLDPRLHRAVRLVAPYVDQSWGPHLVPRHGPILLLLAYCTLLAAALLSATAQRLRPPGAPAGHRGTSLLLVGAVLAGGVTTTRVSASDYYRERETGYACSPDERVCAWQRGGSIAPWLEADEAARHAVVGLAHDPVRFAEQGVPAGTGHVVLTAPSPRPATHDIAALMLREHSARIAAGRCRADMVGRTEEDLYGVLAPALVGTGTRPATESARRLLDDCA